MNYLEKFKEDFELGKNSSYDYLFKNNVNNGMNNINHNIFNNYSKNNQKNLQLARNNRKYSESKIVQVVICPDCFNSKKCYVCKNIKKIVFTDEPVLYVHSRCIKENECFSCGRYATSLILNKCESCKKNEIKFRPGLCYWCGLSLSN